MPHKHFNLNAVCLYQKAISQVVTHKTAFLQAHRIKADENSGPGIFQRRVKQWQCETLLTLINRGRWFISRVKNEQIFEKALYIYIIILFLFFSDDCLLSNAVFKRYQSKLHQCRRTAGEKFFCPVLYQAEHSSLNTHTLLTFTHSALWSQMK